MTALRPLVENAVGSLIHYGIPKLENLAMRTLSAIGVSKNEARLIKRTIDGNPTLSVYKSKEGARRLAG